ncbi:hypothetical protein CEP51_011536 [Fusarium floridanum]|uniref:Zn(2)-C6 fungal-type domain-containing protein n=2 Tax=Fusarium solani species complex TaxID=232080 RepID=A0A428RAE7_9HYPO|nr:hypothetical protein CEP51_011536 [Fusarium floridanum]RSL98894.1 hypothetical protein CDV31_012415 [Fusarium ambrosium]
MSSRRTHTKSRTGCINCKRRKVKCDEARPACFHCKRHGVPCSLSSSNAIESPIDPGHSIHSAHLPNLTPSTPGSIDSPTDPNLFVNLGHPSPSDQMAPFPPQELWTRDCELMHHYCTVTSRTLSVREDMIHVWNVAIPRLGYQSPFVMHGILALAAAHKAYLIPASRRIYLPLADYHQTLGSEGYRHQLQTFDLSNWMPVFGFASVVVLHMLTLPTRMENHALEAPLTNLLELANLLRGIKTTLQPIIPRVVRTEFAPVVYGVWLFESDEKSAPCPPLDNSPLPPDTWDALKRLRAFQEADIPSGGISHYLHAVGQLEISAKLFAFAGLYAETGAAIFWLYTIDDSIFIDLNSQKPHALLLFAYFLVHIAALEGNFWYLRGWARQIMIKIEEGLVGQPKFQELLQWPKARVSDALALT